MFENRNSSINEFKWVDHKSYWLKKTLFEVILVVFFLKYINQIFLVLSRYSIPSFYSLYDYTDYQSQLYKFFLSFCSQIPIFLFFLSLFRKPFRRCFIFLGLLEVVGSKTTFPYFRSWSFRIRVVIPLSTYRKLNGGFHFSLQVKFTAS